jgi:hypothetical protein
VFPVRYELSCYIVYYLDELRVVQSIHSRRNIHSLHRIQEGGGIAGRPRDRSLIPGRGKRFFSSPQRPDRVWSPPNILSNGYRELSTHFHLVPRVKICGVIPPRPYISMA